MVKEEQHKYIAREYIKSGGTAYQFEHRDRYYIKTEIEKIEKKDKSNEPKK